MEEQDKFLEYCSGKVFLISWTHVYGHEVSDRWITFEKDADIVFNYLKSSAPKTEEFVKFNAYSQGNCSKYKVAFALNSELDINDVGFIIGEVVNIKVGRASSILQQLIKHINKTIGEDCGN